MPPATTSIDRTGKALQCNQKWDAAGDDSAVIAVILLCKSWPWLRGGGGGEVCDGGVWGVDGPQQLLVIFTHGGDVWIWTFEV